MLNAGLIVYATIDSSDSTVINMGSGDDAQEADTILVEPLLPSVPNQENVTSDGVYTVGFTLPLILKS